MIEAPPVDSRAAPTPPRSAATRRRLWVVGSIVVVAIAFLLFKTLTSAVTYFKTVDEALAARTTLGTSTFQLEGLVVAGSIHQATSTVVDFTIKGSHDRAITVTNTGAPPELFQANIPVVIVGHFVGTTDHFASDQILVKHSNSYIAAHPGRVRAPNGSVR